MKRVRKPKDKDTIFLSLTSKEHELIIDRLSDVFTLAACIGFKNGKHVPFEKSSEPIAWHNFREHSQVALRMIAFCHTKDPDVLLQGNERGEDKMLEIVEGFANGGCEILKKKIIEAEETGTDRLTAITELIMMGYEDDEGVSGEDILKKFLK